MNLLLQNVDFLSKLLNQLQFFHHIQGLPNVSVGFLEGVFDQSFNEESGIFDCEDFDRMVSMVVLAR